MIYHTSGTVKVSREHDTGPDRGVIEDEYRAAAEAHQAAFGELPNWVYDENWYAMQVGGRCASCGEIMFGWGIPHEGPCPKCAPDPDDEEDE